MDSLAHNPQLSEEVATEEELIIICDEVMQNIIDNFEVVSEEESPKEESPKEESPNEELPEEDTAASYPEEELIIICDDVMIKMLDLS